MVVSSVRRSSCLLRMKEAEQGTLAEEALPRCPVTCRHCPQSGIAVSRGQRVCLAVSTLESADGDNRPSTSPVPGGDRSPTVSPHLKQTCHGREESNTIYVPTEI
ncbi:Smc [Platysternon megacephalum]|uniref:Smc n=1 Tax=Platysternon megacephalum TaxID=55544 RepID=A0A4D9DF81_9SAUR|nr:Smc [Platysternon megacephalum]